jgi:cysteine desulfurase
MTVKTPIYMDGHATTPVDPRVVEAMLPYFTQVFGNAASRNHSFGWAAEEAVEKARETIARAIGADPKEIVFTSGATESNNLAIKGVAEMYAEKGNHIITVVTEHKAVLDPCKRLSKQGFDVTYLGVQSNGLIDLEALKAAMTDKTILVSIMTANNEIGVIQPMADIAKLCAERDILFHTDATQAIGKIPFDVQKMGVHLASFTAHKLYGPKGVGALYVRRRKPRVRVAPMLDGGGHERGMRSGTLNVASIVGFAKAVEIAVTEMPEETASPSHARPPAQAPHDRDRSRARERHAGQQAAPVAQRFLRIRRGRIPPDGHRDVAVSSGSACTSASLEPSYVLKSLGIGDELAHSSMRFGHRTLQHDGGESITSPTNSSAWSPASARCPPSSKCTTKAWTSRRSQWSHH